MRVTILGCGSSGGVPLLGPDGWGECDPANPKNRRRRVSILVQSGETTVLVDTSPDMKAQLHDAGVWLLDAVIYTHAHADHLHGIDDVRSVNFYTRKPLDAYGTPATLAEIQQRFSYVFSEPDRARFAWYKPSMRPVVIDGPFRIGDIDVVPFVQSHGRGTTLGLRFGPIAYSTDAKALDEAAFAALEGVDAWIVDCVSERPHPTHSHLAQTLEWIERVAPKRALLTHMNHMLDYDALLAKCPPGVEPAYDGLVLDYDG